MSTNPSNLWTVTSDKEPAMKLMIRGGTTVESCVEVGPSHYSPKCMNVWIRYRKPHGNGEVIEAVSVMDRGEAEVVAKMILNKASTLER